MEIVWAPDLAKVPLSQNAFENPSHTSERDPPSIRELVTKKAHGQKGLLSYQGQKETIMKL